LNVIGLIGETEINNEAIVKFRTKHYRYLSVHEYIFYLVSVENAHVGTRLFASGIYYLWLLLLHLLFQKFTSKSFQFNALWTKWGFGFV